MRLPQRSFDHVQTSVLLVILYRSTSLKNSLRFSYFKNTSALPQTSIKLSTIADWFTPLRVHFSSGNGFVTAALCYPMSRHKCHSYSLRRRDPIVLGSGGVWHGWPAAPLPGGNCDEAPQHKDIYLSLARCAHDRRRSCATAGSCWCERQELNTTNTWCSSTSTCICSQISNFGGTGRVQAVMLRTRRAKRSCLRLWFMYRKSIKRRVSHPRDGHPHKVNTGCGDLQRIWMVRCKPESLSDISTVSIAGRDHETKTPRN